MTALPEYERLETPGVWRAGPESQRRDVIVSVGDATLVIHDAAGRPVAHWSLAALRRTNPGLRPAVYTPGPGETEELELTNPEMIAAVEKIARAVRSRRPREGRVRYVLLAAALVAVIAAGVVWLPDAMIRHAAGVVPPAKRADIGARLVDDIRRITGPPCTSPLATHALDALGTRLLDGPGRLVVLPIGPGATAHLPGDLILIDRALVENPPDPAVLAGYILAEKLRAEVEDPLEALLRRAGPGTALRLLTTGDVPEPVLEAHAERVLTTPPEPVDDAALLAAFEAYDVPATPYALALDRPALAEADPVDPTLAQPILRDADWVSLQGICGN